MATAAGGSIPAAAADAAAALGLSQAQREQYAREGWCTVERLFSDEECDALIEHMAAVHAGTVPMSRFAPPAPGEAHREGTDQVHIYDKTCFDFILDPKLEAPLRDALDEEGAVWGHDQGGEPEGIKSHYWWTGSAWSQGWHTDGTSLPGCMGVWIPLIDVDDEVGTLALRPRCEERLPFLAPFYTQTIALPRQARDKRRNCWERRGILRRSHNGLRIEHDDLRHGAFAGQRTHSGDSELRAKLTEQALAENDALGAGYASLQQFVYKHCHFTKTGSGLT